MKEIRTWEDFRKDLIALSTVELRQNPTLAELLAAAPVDEVEPDGDAA